MHPRIARWLVAGSASQGNIEQFHSAASHHVFTYSRSDDAAIAGLSWQLGGYMPETQPT